MQIRDVRLEDSIAVSHLLTSLGYPETADFIGMKIQQLRQHPDEYMYVVEGQQGELLAMISISIIFQLALKGDFARISYFVVEEAYQGQGLARLLEQKCEEIARQRQCDRIELHCHARRTSAHNFYRHLGYVESPKYFIKMLK